MGDIHTAAFSQAIDSVPVVKDDELRRARLSVCDHAKDADDAQLLMDMLGLLPGVER